MLAVVCDTAGGRVAYPFDDEDREFAERFAAFVTAEIDPARVMRGDQVGPADSVLWRSSLVELLDWHEHMTRKTVAALDLPGPEVADSAPTH